MSDYGTGFTKRYVTRRGRERFSAMIPDGKGEHRSVGTFDTEDEADRVRAAAIIELIDSPSRLRTTVGHFGDIFIQRIAAQRSIRSTRSRWKHHVAPTELGKMPIEDAQPSHIRDFARALPLRISPRTGNPISRQSCLHIWTLVRRCFAEALTDGIIAHDPTGRVKLPGKRGRRPWTYLTTAEIKAVLALPHLSEEQLAVFQVAIFQGLRQGEIAALTWECIDLDAANPRMHVVASWTRPATKNGEHRTIPILPLTVPVLRGWSAASGRRSGLVFPSPSGAMYAEGYDWRWGERRVEGHRSIPSIAGVARRVTFHALRHTCGSALVNGFWGEAWTLAAVRDLLGHSSVAMTEKYAHLDQAVMDAAAAATTGKSQHTESNTESVAAQLAAIRAQLSELAGKTPTEPEASTLGIERPRQSNNREHLAPRFRVQSVFELVESMARALERGDSPPVRDVRLLARALLDADPMTALARRIDQLAAKRIRGSDVAELVTLAMGRFSPSAAKPAAGGAS